VLQEYRRGDRRAAGSLRAAGRRPHLGIRRRQSCRMRGGAQVEERHLRDEAALRAAALPGHGDRAQARRGGNRRGTQDRLPTDAARHAAADERGYRVI